jgi:hypothetical protein
MSLTMDMQITISVSNHGIDPGLCSTSYGLTAAGKYGVEGGIHGQYKALAAQKFGKTARQMKSLEREYAAPLWFNPENIARCGAVGHWEDTAGIGAQHSFRVEPRFER